MSKSQPTRTLREHPDLHQLRRQAKELLDSFRSGDPHAVSEVKYHYRDSDPATFGLHDAQLVLARAYGFDSWPKLKSHVDGVTPARFAEAVQADNLEEVRAMLKVRPELVNMETGKGERSIHHAVFNRSQQMARLLMMHGADARTGIWPHRDATSAFNIASERGYDEIVRIILEEESRRPVPPEYHDPNAFPPELVDLARGRDESGIIAFVDRNPSYINVPYYLMAPLHLAAACLLERLAVWLLDHGADANFRDRNGPSPLELVGAVAREADTQKISRMVSLLRSRGAEITPRAAVVLGDGDWLRARHTEGKLVNRLPIFPGFRGLLEIAVKHRRADMLSLLLDLGLDPDEHLQKGESDEFVHGGPLRECARAGQMKMAELLLERGATLTAPIAVWMNKGDWLRRQHAAGTLENPIGEKGGLLSQAVLHDRVEMLALLLDLGLDPNESTHFEKRTDVINAAGAPLRACAEQGKIQMAKMLLDHGADPSAPNSYSGSPIDVAYGRGDKAMIELFASHGGYLNAAEVGFLGQTEIARAMLAGKIDPHLDAGRWGGATLADQLLNGAATFGHLEILRMVLEQIDWLHDRPRIIWPLPGEQRWNAEERERYIACFRLILERCGPDWRDDDHAPTVLHDVVARDSGDGVELAKLLLDAGARLDLRDNLFKSTPLGWACRWGRLELAKLLLERGADPIEADAEVWARPRAWADKMKHDDVLMVLQEYERRRS